MTTPAVGDAHALALEYLAAVQAALALSPGGQIDRAFVSPGLPDWDCCPQLSVHIASVDDAETAPTNPFLQSGHRITLTGVVLIVSLVATILRCNPVAAGKDNANAPGADQIAAAAENTNGDLWAITNYLIHAKRQNTLFSPQPDGERREVWIDPAISLRPQGGCAGWAFGVRVQLDGFQPA